MAFHSNVQHRVFATYLSCAVFLVTTHCREARATMTLTQDQADAAAAKLEAFLPGRLSEFTARGAAVRRVVAATSAIRIERTYISGSRTLTIELATGDVRQEMRIIAMNDDHNFGSDSLTYWRTVSVNGRRSRIAEGRDTMTNSTVYVRVSRQVVARLTVAPRTSDGESATLAAVLDLEGIGRAGVAGPETPEP